MNDELIKIITGISTHDAKIAQLHDRVKNYEEKIRAARECMNIIGKQRKDALENLEKLLNTNTCAKNFEQVWSGQVPVINDVTPICENKGSVLVHISNGSV